MVAEVTIFVVVVDGYRFISVESPGSKTFVGYANVHTKRKSVYSKTPMFLYTNIHD